MGVTRTANFLVHLEEEPLQQAHCGAFRAWCPHKPGHQIFLVLNTSAPDAFEALKIPYFQRESSSQIKVL